MWRNIKYALSSKTQYSNVFLGTLLYPKNFIQYNYITSYDIKKYIIYTKYYVMTFNLKIKNIHLFS